MIKYSGNRKLFCNHFVMGGSCTGNPSKFFLEDYEAVSKWLRFKETHDFGNYDASNTMFVSFPKIFELDTLEAILEWYAEMYRKDFPFSEKEDFIEHIFADSIIYMKRFLKRDLSPYGQRITKINFAFYVDVEANSFQKQDFALPINREPEYFQQYYKQVLKIFESFSLDQPLNSNKEERFKNKKSSLTHSEVALIHVYKGHSITRANGQKIANDYGFTSDTSGEKLYQSFIKYFNPTDRKGDTGSKIKNLNKIKRIEKILPHLDDPEKSRPLDEIKILKELIDRRYQ